MTPGAQSGTVAGNPGDVSESQDFGALFTRAHRVLWLVAFGVVQNRTLADDVVQEAALIALGKFSGFKPGTVFSAWMATIVRYVALNQARSARRRRAAPVERDLDVPAQPQARPAELRMSPGGDLPPDQELFDDAVLAALRKVADIPRMCILLRTVEGLDYNEISRILQIPEGTAMSHVHRTRQRLRRDLAHLQPPHAAESEASE